MIFPGFPGVLSFFQVFQVEWEPWPGCPAVECPTGICPYCHFNADISQLPSKASRTLSSSFLLASLTLKFSIWRTHFPQQTSQLTSTLFLSPPTLVLVKTGDIKTEGWCITLRHTVLMNINWLLVKLNQTWLLAKGIGRHIHCSSHRN